MTLIYFRSEWLADACRVGFIARHVGRTYCEGWVHTDRLDSLAFPFTVVSNTEE